MTKKVTTEMIKKKLYDRVGSEYKLLSEYHGGNVKIKLLHKTCGKIYSVTPNHFFYDNTRCTCRRNAKDPKVFEKEFRKVAKGEYTQLSEYKRTHQKIIIKHNLCGTVFKATPHSFLSGSGCPACFGNIKKTTEEFKSEMQTLTNGEFTLITDYVNNHTYVTIRHNICGNEYRVTPKDFLHGNRCPFCKQSKGERFIQSILSERNIEYEIQKSFDDLVHHNSKLPFDFFLPTYNLLIEYDGIQHFKEVKYFGGADKLTSQKRRDKVKNEYAKKNKIRLLRIPYTYSEEKIRKVIISYL